MKVLLLAFVFLLASCQEAGEPFDPLESLAFIENEDGLGSGVFISPTQVLTARHVVEEGDDYNITDSNGSVYRVESINRILYTDAAIITLSTPSPVTPATLSCAVPHILDELIVAGNPLGVREIVTVQRVAGFIPVGEDGYRMMTTGMLAAGMSGGPVYNMDGEVVGIAVEEIAYEQNGGVFMAELNGVVPLYDIIELCKDDPGA